MKTGLLWDIFCQVVDNYGDLGVCWRLSQQLSKRNHKIRLWIDDSSALTWMAPNPDPNIKIYPWPQQNISNLPLSDVWLETFGCNIPIEFIKSFSFLNFQKKLNPPICINLEYLSAESYVEKCHTLPSTNINGLNFSIAKYFFYPGFTDKTGGILREDDLKNQQLLFDRKEWLNAFGIPWSGERLISLFCYEPVILGRWLEQLAMDSAPNHVLVTNGRTKIAVQQALLKLPQSFTTGWGNLRLSYLPFLNQLDFDHLLWSCDINLIRGEDSLVRAIWAGKPFVWHVYPQSDGVHRKKLLAFLEVLKIPNEWQQLHDIWNCDNDESMRPIFWPTSITESNTRFDEIRNYLAKQTDLVTQLLYFINQKREQYVQKCEK